MSWLEVGFPTPSVGTGPGQVSLCVPVPGTDPGLANVVWWVCRRGVLYTGKGGIEVVKRVGRGEWIVGEIGIRFDDHQRWEWSSVRPEGGRVPGLRRRLRRLPEGINWALLC